MTNLAHDVYMEIEEVPFLLNKITVLASSIEKIDYFGGSDRLDAEACIAIMSLLGEQIKKLSMCVNEEVSEAIRILKTDD